MNRAALISAFVLFSLSVSANSDYEQQLKRKIYKAEKSYRLCKSKAKSSYDLELCKARALIEKNKIRSEFYGYELGREMLQAKRKFSDLPIVKCMRSARTREDMTRCGARVNHEADR